MKAVAGKLDGAEVEEVEFYHSEGTALERLKSKVRRILDSGR